MEYVQTLRKKGLLTLKLVQKNGHLKIQNQHIKTPHKSLKKTGPTICTAVLNSTNKFAIVNLNTLNKNILTRMKSLSHRKVPLLCLLLLVIISSCDCRRRVYLR